MNLHKYFLLLLCLGILFACKKEIKNPPTPEPEEPTERERLRASIYDYFNKYSLWTENIADLDEKERLDFVKKYSSNGNLLVALKNMTPFYTGYRGSIDRFSFLDEYSAEGNLSYADGFRMDTNEGYGLYFFWGHIEEENKARPVIYFVEGGSPGQRDGIKRGSVVLAINEVEDTSVPVVYRDGEYYIDDERLAEKIHDNWYAAMDKPALRLKLKGMFEDVITEHKLSHSSAYEIKPIIKDSVYTYPEKNVGYLAYSSFEQTDRTTIGRNNREDIDEAFRTFEENSIKELILDLRYNTGGYVEAAIYLANKIINAESNGKLMFSYETNNYLARTRDFENVLFERNNRLDLRKVFFLVTEQTASAAELLISVLKPYMEVELIGDGPRTFGKPVGFFPEEITNDVTLWVTSFKTNNNAKTEYDKKFQNYWDGLPIATTEIVPDRIFYDFGDTNEDMIAKALTLAGVSGSMRASSRKISSTSSAVRLGIINKPRERNMLKKRD